MSLFCLHVVANGKNIDLFWMKMVNEVKNC